MSTKKETTAPVEEKKDDRVEVYIPKGNVNDEPNLFVAVNGKNFLLPRGKKSMVPKHIAEEIARSHKAEEVMDEHSATLVDAAK
jgi:hypothetical protein